jgi:hypothetical protein
MACLVTIHAPDETYSESRLVSAGRPAATDFGAALASGSLISSYTLQLISRCSA